MDLDLQFLDSHLLRSSMIFNTVNKKEIIKEVKVNISLAKKEILATMLLEEEINNPLPKSYFNLLRNKVDEGVILKRLGFGKKEEYNKIRNKTLIDKKNYIFRFTTRGQDYQRLIIIDRKKIFFGRDGVFFKSKYQPLIKVFLKYFLDRFKKGKI